MHVGSSTLISLSLSTIKIPPFVGAQARRNDSRRKLDFIFIKHVGRLSYNRASFAIVCKLQSRNLITDLQSRNLITETHN